MPAKSTGRLLVVDDDPATRLFITETLAERSYHVDGAENLSRMWETLGRYSVDVLLLDLNLDGDDAMESLPSIIRAYPYSRVIIITGHGSIDSAVTAMEAGASGYITKPIDVEKLAGKLEEILPQNKADNAPSSMEEAGIIGASKAIRTCWTQVQRMKDVDSTVLIHGDSGTGKELLARALHNSSHRKSERFEAVNCGAIPSELLESELFGHKKGSFTDAKADKKGIFEICSRGTLFLDEIAELPLPQQTKLLRVLQEREITPIGANRAVPISTRVIAATNKSLPELVKKGEFREDLYFRLSVLVIRVPSLAERRDDIPHLVRHFADKFAERFGKEIQPPPQELLARLSALDWPGNIRQLQNAVERGVVLAQDGKMSLEDMVNGTEMAPTRAEPLPNAEASENEPFVPLTKAKEGFEADYLAKLLRATGGNISEAARISGRYRADLYRLFTRYNIEPAKFKREAEAPRRASR